MARAPQVFSAMLFIVTLAQARVYTTQGVELSFYDNDTSCTGTPVAAHATPDRDTLRSPHSRVYRLPL